ncbi:MAG: hypothetical protein IPG07_06170 [Crocinitomicaceae bacterium]|nr:hypothetical protein [Crocinitomicaceae bacterium]
MPNTKIRSKFIQTAFFLLFLTYNYSSIAQLRVEVYDTDFKEVSDDTFSNKKGHWIIDKTKNTLVYGEENTSTDSVLVYEWPIISVETNNDFIAYAVDSNGKILLVNFYTNKNQVSVAYSDAYVFYTGDVNYSK